jgi:phosphate transport system substrate-binding protein
VPSLASINDGTYKPLSRPIFIYVDAAVAKREDVKTFVEFYLENAPSLVEEVGYVKLPAEIYVAARSRFAKQVVGTLFATSSAKGKALLDLYR